MARAKLRAGAAGAVATREVAGGLFEARCHVRRLDGVRVQLSRRGETSDGAEARLRDAVARVASRTHASGERIAQSEPLRALCYEFMRTRSQGDGWAHAVSTAILTSFLADVPVARVDEDAVASFRARLRGTTRETQLAMRALREVCELGVRNGYWETNPAASVGRSRHRYAAGAGTPVTIPMILDVLEAHANRPGRRGPVTGSLMSDVLSTVAATGASLGDVLRWRWVDIDDMGGLYRTPGERFGKRDRVLVPRLREVLARRRAAKVTGEYVFVTATGRRVTPAEIRAALRAPLEWACLGEREFPPALSSEEVSSESKAA